MSYGDLEVVLNYLIIESMAPRGDLELVLVESHDVVVTSDILILPKY